MSGEDYEQRKRIFDEIKRFTRVEQEALFRLLRDNQESFSENSNGIFFDLMNVSELTVKEIKKLIVFSIDNRRLFETREKEMGDISNLNPGLHEN
jgi:hypothetical protein